MSERVTQPHCTRPIGPGNRQLLSRCLPYPRVSVAEVTARGLDLKVLHQLTYSPAVRRAIFFRDDSS